MIFVHLKFLQMDFKYEQVFLSQLSRASITFGFFKGRWPNYCICSATSLDGKNVKVKVDGFGKKYRLLSKFQSYS